MRSLYHELVSTGKMTNLEFHDAVLKENSMPIVVLRAKLTEKNLTKDFDFTWSFLDK